MAHDETNQRRPERRQRARRTWQAPGFVYVGQTVTEIELRDISRDVHDEGGRGVGFISPRMFEAGAIVHLKVGLGPLRQPRAATVAYCRRRPDGKFWVGATLHPATTAIVDAA